MMEKSFPTLYPLELKKNMFDHFVKVGSAFLKTHLYECILSLCWVLLVLCDVRLLIAGHLLLWSTGSGVLTFRSRGSPAQ